MKQTESVAESLITLLLTSYQVFQFERSETLAAFSEDISSRNRFEPPGLHASSQVGCELHLSYCVGPWLLLIICMLGDIFCQGSYKKEFWINRLSISKILPRGRLSVN